MDQSLVMDNEKLVYKICHKFLGRARRLGHEAQDVFNTGFIGLIKAMENFDPERGFKFTTYAVPKIEGEVLRMLRDSNMGPTVPRTVKELAMKIRKENMEKESIQIISDTFNASTSIAESALKYIFNPVAFSTEDKVMQDDEDLTLGDTLGQEEDLSGIYVREFIDSLSDRDKMIVEMRVNGKKQQEIADEIGTSQVQVSRLLNGLKTKWVEFENGTEENRMAMAAKGDMKRAKELLEEGKKSISEIVQETGCNRNSLYTYKTQMKREKNEPVNEWKEKYMNLKEEIEKLRTLHDEALEENKRLDDELANMQHEFDKVSVENGKLKKEMEIRDYNENAVEKTYTFEEPDQGFEEMKDELAMYKEKYEKAAAFLKVVM